VSRTIVEKLLRRLELDPLAEDCFLGATGRGEGRVFGGLLAAQSLVAAGRTVEEGLPHSLHLYFVRGGRHGVPITWSVTRVRDGYSFALRQVVGEQSGLAILTATASFTTTRSGLAHQDAMPDVPDPEGLDDWEDLRVRVLGPDTVRRPDSPLEVRDCDPGDAVPRVGRPARRRLWMRPRSPLPTSDPLLHAAVLAYGSDRGLLGAAGRPHGLMWGTGLGASLDHAVWFHRPIRFDDWVLYDMASPVAAAGRGLCHGGLYARTGERIASVTQEGLIRRRRVSPSDAR
jgi:acyl-CoA thioesterase-2